MTRIARGSVREWSGSWFVCIGSVPYVTKDKRSISLPKWVGTCAQCGAAFTMMAVPVQRYVNKRCPKHHRPSHVAKRKAKSVFD